MFYAMANEDVGREGVLFDIEDGEAGDEVGIEMEDTEVEPVRKAVDPGKPTDKQIEEHRMTHLPFRTWCRWCVLGRGRGLQHQTCGTSLDPVVGLDYFFLAGAGVVLTEELGMDDEQLSAARQRGDVAKWLAICGRSQRRCSLQQQTLCGRGARHC